MKGERGNFKSRVFGGFNRHDVIDYIETLAKERNDLAMENQKLLGRVEALEERLDELTERLPKSCEPDDSIQSELPSHEELVQRRVEQVLTNAHGVLAEVKSAYDELCRDININVSQADHELRSVQGKLSALQETLRTAGERLSDLDIELDIMPLSGPEVDNAEGL